MTFSINQLRIANAVGLESGKRKTEDGDRFLSKRASVRGIVESTGYSVTWNITDSAEFQNTLAFIYSKRSSRYFDWIPPDESTAAKFKFASMPTIAFPSGSQWIVSAVLKFGPGVP